MGIILKGILGGFRGTVGTVIGGTWKGINYMKSLPVISNTDPTPRQLEQRAKFKTVVNFLRPMMEVIQIGFKSVAKDMTQYNAAMAYNYEHALDGNYPNFHINYSFALITTGTLHNVAVPAASAEANSEVKFTWTNNAGLGKATATDPVILVVYCPELAEMMYHIGATTRDDLTASIDATVFSGKVVHTWVSCMSADGKLMAKSAYTGQLNVS